MNLTDGPPPSPNNAGAIVGAIFGGVLMGIAVTFLSMFLLDKFYFKRFLNNSTPQAGIDNPTYVTGEVVQIQGAGTGII